ncbi:hypothetical protein C8A03DRAFT_39565 [Achaetomium macrosporum]|uniref:Uncharacterized protein n=1 Tax=Achaetomium macrosporum TaxID=79813 RepID=A0AAN7H2W8_9PEZI|nr:hypothetical protein C8A03DRAFT_39565 [Achaetomium macrosporum]
MLLLPLLFSSLPLTTTLSLPLNTTALLPWQIPSLSTHSPSGYPANHPYSRLRFTIHDPNTIVLGPTRFGDAAFPPSTANCTVWWLPYHGSEDDPMMPGLTHTCGDPDTMAGKWTFQVLNGSTGDGGGSPTTDFTLRVMLSEAVVLGTGGVVNLKFEGEAAFRRARDGNLEGACGGSGVCSWGLKEEDAPVLVRQRLVEVKCVTGKCEEGEE